MLRSIDQAGPAAAAGLLRGDVLVAVDGLAVTGVDDLIRLLNADRIGRSVTVSALRRGKLRVFDVTPTERPPKA